MLRIRRRDWTGNGSVSRRRRGRSHGTVDGWGVERAGVAAFLGERDDRTQTVLRARPLGNPKPPLVPGGIDHQPVLAGVEGAITA
jgi:hypothetical protein